MTQIQVNQKTLGVIKFILLTVITIALITYKFITL